MFETEKAGENFR